MSLIVDAASYQPALLALAVLTLVVLIQAVLTAPLAFIREEQLPGKPLQGDHNLLSFRVLRTHANSVESLGPFGFALLLAIAAGSSSTLVNWCAGLHVLFRLIFWAVYYAGAGKVAGGPRTLSYIGATLANFVLAGSAVVALL